MMQLKRIKYLNKDKLPPGTIRKHGVDSGDIKISIINYDVDTVDKQYISLDKIVDIDLSKNSKTWIHCPSTINSNLLEKIGNKFNIHSLILENIQNIDHRPKLNDTENFNFIIQKSLQLRDGNLIKNHIGYIIFKDLLITFANGTPFSLIEERILKKEGKVRNKSIDYLLFICMDLLSDEYFELLDLMEQKTIKFEESLIKDNYKLDINEFLQLKSQLDIVRHYVTPLSTIIDGIINSTKPPIDISNLIYYKDLLNNTIQLTDLIKTTSKSIENILNLSINISGYKMNNIMKVLTIISTIFIPLTFIAGVYGMNFEYMPELHFKFSYPITLGIMVIIALIMVNFFRKRRWF